MTFTSLYIQRTGTAKDTSGSESPQEKPSCCAHAQVHSKDSTDNVYVCTAYASKYPRQSSLYTNVLHTPLATADAAIREVCDVLAAMPSPIGRCPLEGELRRSKRWHRHHTSAHLSTTPSSRHGHGTLVAELSRRPNCAASVVGEDCVVHTALSSHSSRAPALGGGSGLGQTGTGAGASRSHSLRMESSVTPRATSSSRQVADRKRPGRRPPSIESA